MMNKVKIWGEIIPYNVPGKSKIEVMNIKRRPKAAAFGEFVLTVFGTKLNTDMSKLDTFTFMSQIKTGKASVFMDDVPTLTPFPAAGDTAVIVVPGGGFCYQEREKEGYKIARSLNEKGITAFVLDYRMNPYEAPVYYLDMQRAIRYVRYHASYYGVDPDKIGTCGFSAGGYICGASEILLGDSPVEAPGYTPDDVDAVGGHPSFMGLIYPLVSHDENQNMLGIFDRNGALTEEGGTELKKKYSLTGNVKAGCAPQFFAYGNKDPLKGFAEYAEKLDETGADHKTLMLDGATHGFSATKKYAYWMDEFVAWIRQTVG